MILSLALNWANLWPEGSTLEQVPQDHRNEVVGHVLTDLAQKIHHEFDLRSLYSFNVKKLSQNLALIEYPHLSKMTEIDFNLLANHIL